MTVHGKNLVQLRQRVYDICGTVPRMLFMFMIFLYTPLIRGGGATEQEKGNAWLTELKFNSGEQQFAVDELWETRANGGAVLAAGTLSKF